MIPIRSFIAAGIICVLAGSAVFAGDWVGKYLTTDTQGNPFEIELTDNGNAIGLKHGTALRGTWASDGDAAVIKWDTGWVTKLTADGDSYKKTAYRAGTSMQESPTHSTAAKKVD